MSDDAVSLIARLRRIGPAIVVAAVVLGPGSIVSASKVGCEFGLELLWVVPLAGALMIAMTTASMIIGATCEKTLCQSVADSFGRPAACAVGAALLIAITLFQASNNNALLMAAEGFLSDENGRGQDLGLSSLARTAVLLLVNLGVIALLLLGKRNLYRYIERSMAVLVGLMVLAFGMTMIVAGPSLLEIVWGFVPSFPVGTDGESGAPAGTSWMSVGALMATTFSVAGAFYQAYQVREKGWTPQDLRVGVTDSIVGIGTLAAVTSMILITAAAALHGKVQASELTDAAAVAVSLEPLFGSSAKFVFAAGVLAGAVSSFVVNALIGGVVFSDAIGLGSRFSSLSVRVTTIVALLLGWFVASLVTFAEIDLVSFIVIAQALTVLAFPILALVILWQLHRVDPALVPKWVKPLCWTGMVVVVALSVRTVSRLI
tara:strand:+ start:342780 stop:344072 length:1293 start_codon:yes stop_codon:yes gene_type:complete